MLSKAGAETASFHPVQTFAAKTAGYSKLFRNIFIAIEGSKRAADAGYKIAFSAGAVPFTLKKKDKNASSYMLCNGIKLSYCTCIKKLKIFTLKRYE